MKRILAMAGWKSWSSLQKILFVFLCVLLAPPLLILGALFLFKPQIQTIIDSNKGGEKTNSSQARNSDVVKGNYTKLDDSAYFLSTDRTWYSEKRLTRECFSFDVEGFIKDQQAIKEAGGGDYSIRGEIKVNDTVVQMSVKVYPAFKEFTVYRGQDLCESLKTAREELKNKELNKFK